MFAVDAVCIPGIVIPPVIANRPPEPSPAPIAVVETETPCPRPPKPVVPDPGGIRPARSKHDNAVIDIGTQVPGCIAEVNEVGRSAVNIDVSVVE